MRGASAPWSAAACRRFWLIRNVASKRSAFKQFAAVTCVYALRVNGARLFRRAGRAFFERDFLDRETIKLFFASPA